jgi:ferredoxin
MIVGDLKPLEEILHSLRGYRRIHVVGCGSCVSVCLSGGDREVRLLAQELVRGIHHPEGVPVVTADTLMRQCELDMIRSYAVIPADTEVILSLACGAGVQTMAEALAPVPVLPGLNTTFLGASMQPGQWQEMCAGCGDCLLGHTGGICPIARCSKSLLNGPCGGTNGKNCEVSPDIPCAWVQIIDRLGKRNRLDLLMEIRAPKDWRPAFGEGPRVRRRTGVAGSPGISTEG